MLKEKKTQKTSKGKSSHSLELHACTTFQCIQCINYELYIPVLHRTQLTETDFLFMYAVVLNSCTVASFIIFFFYFFCIMRFVNRHAAFLTLPKQHIYLFSVSPSKWVFSKKQHPTHRFSWPLTERCAMLALLLDMFWALWYNKCLLKSCKLCISVVFLTGWEADHMPIMGTKQNGD